MLTWKNIEDFVKNGVSAPENKVIKTEEEWKKLLSDDVFFITRQSGTEHAFSSEMCSRFEPGLYACACCGTLLFDASEKFDVIVNLASVEHVWNVQDYINILSKNCKNGGIIITMTINDSSLVYGVARAVYNFGMKLPMERLYDKHHLNHFSKNSLEYLHTKNSLDIIDKPYT